MIRLVTITPDNWRLGLSVREDQYDYVSDSSGILARAYAYRDNRSQDFVIYDDNVPVGMAMYHDLDDWKAYDFSQFFIDHRYQRKGYGLKAAEMILEKMKADGKYDRVVLCYINGDEAAKNLYENLVFIIQVRQMRMRSSWKKIYGFFSVVIWFSGRMIKEINCLVPQPAVTSFSYVWELICW